MKLTDDKPIQFGKSHDLSNPTGQVQKLPQGMYQANKYYTDDAAVIHLWNDKGESFDIAVPKQKYIKTVEGDYLT